MMAADFDAYVQARTPALLRTAFLLTGDQHRAEDLVQDALIKTHRAWNRLQDSYPDAYTRKVMYHLNIAWWRRGGYNEMPTDSVPERAAAGGDSAQSVADRLALQQALGRLTSKQRAVIVLRYFEDASESETAEILGVAVGTVKSQTAKALMNMRQELAELANGVKGTEMTQRVLRGSRRVAIRNGVVTVAAAIVAVVIGGAAFAALQNKPPLPPAGTPTPGVTSSVEPTTAPSQTPTTAPTKAPVNVASATFEVPAFPGSWAEVCPAGRHTFKDGYSLIETTPRAGVDQHDTVFKGDLDGQPGDEIVVVVTCATEGASPLMALALKPNADGTISTLGFVSYKAGAPLLLLQESPLSISIKNGVVNLTVIGEFEGNVGTAQVRGYAYRNGAFVQVSGPTKF